MKAAIYVRDDCNFSFNDMAFQTKKIKAWCKRKNISINLIFRDTRTRIGIGAQKRKSLTRSGIIGLLDGISRKEISVQNIVVFSLARLQHPSLDFDVKKEFEQLGVRIIHIGEKIAKQVKKKPKANKKTKLVFYPDMPIMERMREGVRQSIKKGGRGCGPIPYGYRAPEKIPGISRAYPFIPDIHPKESETVKIIFKRYLELGSLKKLETELREKGILTRKGKFHSKSGMAWIIKNQFYIGVVRHDGIVGKGKHKTFIDKKTWKKANEQIKKNSKAGSKICPKRERVLSQSSKKSTVQNTVEKTDSVSSVVPACQKEEGVGVPMIVSTHISSGLILEKPVDTSYYETREYVLNAVLRPQR